MNPHSPVPNQVYENRVKLSCCSVRYCTITALGGLAIVLLSAVIEHQPVALLNAAVGITVPITSYLQSKDGIVVTRMFLNVLFLFMACCYIPFHFHFHGNNVNYAWIVLLSIYASVMYLMHLTYYEIQRYSSFWLLQRPTTLPQAGELFDGVLNGMDTEFLKTLPPNQFENLVLAGGGAKGVYEIAALYPLQKAGILQNIQRFCGTSVGAILAVLFAAGASVEQAMQIAILIDLGMVVPSVYQNIFGFLFYCIPCRIARKKAIPGTTRGLTFRFQYILRRLGCNANITMSQFKAKFGKDLAITVTNNTTQRTEFLTAESHPDMPVYLAMRASSAIPGVFLPVYWKGNLYVDGGCAANYPVWAFDGDADSPCLANKYSKMNMKTIGVNLGFPSLGGISSSITKRRKTTFLRAAKSITRAVTLVRRQRCSTRAFALSIPVREMAFPNIGGMHPAESDLLTSAKTQTTPTVSESVIQMANYPRLFEIFGSMGLSKLCLSTAEYVWKSQDRPHDSVRTIPITSTSVGILEFSVTRDQDRMNQVAKEAVKSTMDFLRAGVS